MRRHGRRRFIALTAAALASATACGTDTSGDSGGSDYPSKDLDWTIAFGPGGGNDIMARTIVEILESEGLYPKNIAVQNREGGSGATGWGHVFKNRGNPYVISTTSGSFITTPLESNTGWTYEDFTLVGLFATDAALLVVSKASGIRDWAQWVDHATQGTVAVGGIGTVNVDFIVHDLLAQHGGYQIDYVPFNDEGQLLTGLTSGSLEAIVSNPGEVMGQSRPVRWWPWCSPARSHWQPCRTSPPPSHSAWPTCPPCHVGSSCHPRCPTRPDSGGSPPCRKSWRPRGGRTTSRRTSSSRTCAGATTLQRSWRRRRRSSPRS